MSNPRHSHSVETPPRTESAPVDASVESQGVVVGRHVALDLHAVQEHLWEDAATLVAWLARTLTESGFHVLGSTSHSFEPHGATGVILLSESHASFHTYPEHRYVAFDLFACGNGDVEEVLRRVEAYWAPGHCRRQELRRGEPRG
ncbi:MAG: adenosylmethionine decarboxylase [Planctomycetales bacterium]|nr:adenosylmethionine decarboxylase [Planctomycetales bacterium]